MVITFSGVRVYPSSMPMRFEWWCVFAMTIFPGESQKVELHAKETVLQKIKSTANLKARMPGELSRKVSGQRRGWLKLFLDLARVTPAGTSVRVYSRDQFTIVFHRRQIAFHNSRIFGLVVVVRFSCCSSVYTRVVKERWGGKNGHCSLDL